MPIARIRITGRWHRISRKGSSALFWSVDPADERWQHGSVVRGLYLACCEDTAWAEWLRATAEAGVPPSRRLPRDVWPLEVDVPDIADLSAEVTLHDLGLWPLRPTQDDWPECQVVGDDLWYDGAAGLLAPSAAHEGHRVLCAFRTTPTIPGVTEIPPPTTYDSIPKIPVGLRT